MILWFLLRILQLREKTEASDGTEGTAQGNEDTVLGSLRRRLSTHLLSNACQVFVDKEVKKSFIAGFSFQE